MRIPPSRRTAGHRSSAVDTSSTKQQPTKRAILFTPRTSEDDTDGPAQMEILAEPTQTELGEDPMDLSLRMTRTRRSSAASTLRVMVKHHQPSAQHIAEKMAASGSQGLSKEELINRFGKSKTNKILEGKLAVENGELYDMSLIKACYHANARKFWDGGIFYIVACECLALKADVAQYIVTMRMTIPLVTKAIIDDIVAARARANGDTTASPRPLAATIGLAVGFYAMMLMFAGLTTHAVRCSNLIGLKTRAGVSDRNLDYRYQC